MGMYLNPNNNAYTKSRKNPLYVDKSLLIQKLNSIVGIDDCFVCFSRPRRFGKSVDANMLVAYYSKGCDSSSLFDDLKISQCDSYKEHLNQHDVIYFDVKRVLSKVQTIDEFIDRLTRNILEEIKLVYTDESLYIYSDLVSTLERINTKYNQSYIFIIDEWDCVFREYKNDINGQKKYLKLLEDLFKTPPFVDMAYMTGILPIKKYGTQSALNMFDEISMINANPYEEFMGFTEDNVKYLCENNHMDFKEMKNWYDGYHINQYSLYSPRSIVSAIKKRLYDNYWTNTEAYESLKDYFNVNRDGIKESIISLLSNEKIYIEPSSFENDITTFHSKDDILTLLVHLGYLGYDFNTQEVYIPNKEVRTQFEIALRDSHWRELDNAISNSMDLLNATWSMNEEKVAYYIEEAHLGISDLKYNSEEALAHTVDIAYFAARGYYNKLIELQTGKGFCDIAYIPKGDKPALLVELKWQESPEAAINQIKKKKYYKVLEDYYDNLLLVGITYQKDVHKDDYKEHHCKIEKYVLD